MATHDRPPAAASLWSLFEASPESDVHTSAWSLTAFLCGLGAALSAPFAIMLAVSLSLGVSGLLLALAGLAATSRPDVAGRALAPLGLVLSLVALGVLGLRYLQVDSAFGDALVPAIQDLLERLNARVGAP